MKGQLSKRNIHLTLHRVINASVETVYFAWTNPEVLCRWFAPGNAIVARAVADVVVGGTFLVEIHGADGRSWITRGVYREVVPHRRLVHTWRWEDSDVESLVTVEFEPESTVRTRLTLTHSQFAQEEVRDEHERGWTECLAKFEVGQMKKIVSTARPDWVSDDMYPFKSRFFAASSGYRMHFVDEGEGEPIVFVHGNPTWSFEFRHLITGLCSEFRCVAPDHVGFGLSSRSDRLEDHHPKSHANRFAAFLDHLDLSDITLFMTDWGGPIGLDFARRHPDRIRRIVIANTWCWPVGDDFHFKSFSFLMSSRIGQYLIKRHNIFVNKVMPKAVGNRKVLTPEIMAHYRHSQPSPGARSASAALPGSIVGASEWLDSIWHDRAAFVDKPAMIFWGHRDIAFRRKELERWKSELSDFELHEFEDCGHFLAEEVPDKLITTLRAQLMLSPASARKENKQ